MNTCLALPAETSSRKHQQSSCPAICQQRRSKTAPRAGSNCSPAREHGLLQSLDARQIPHRTQLDCRPPRPHLAAIRRAPHPKHRRGHLGIPAREIQQACRRGPGKRSVTQLSELLDGTCQNCILGDVLIDISFFHTYCLCLTSMIPLRRPDSTLHPHVKRKAGLDTSHHPFHLSYNSYGHA
ncbi:hypothetical protein EYC84_006996 [Monilinia fructicola]|uniref:Uncharacterized protein n=1 Tax=Monilinia fructicola TaxID=38448 RepID=A0A5M9K7X1_MONFR|nr:hypothetical protein EYC84_006996 [Monilinia fructicola]